MNTESNSVVLGNEFSFEKISQNDPKKVKNFIFFFIFVLSVEASCYRSLNALTEVEDLAETGEVLGTVAHCFISICFQGWITSRVVGASTNIVQSVLVLDCLK